MDFSKLYELARHTFCVADKALDQAERSGGPVNSDNIAFLNGQYSGVIWAIVELGLENEYKAYMMAKDEINIDC